MIGISERTSLEAILFTGASKNSKPISAIWADISDPKPEVRWSSCATMTLLVFLIESNIV